MARKPSSNFFAEKVNARSMPSRLLISNMEYRIENYRRYVPWPALIESLERDLAVLKARAAEQKK